MEECFTFVRFLLVVNLLSPRLEIFILGAYMVFTSNACFHIKCILVVKNECVFSVVSWKYNMSNTTVCRVMIRFFLEHAEELCIFILRENEKYNLQ